MNISSLPKTLAFALRVAVLSRCSQASSSIVVDDRALFRNTTRVELLESGGFAALQTNWFVEQESGQFAYSRRQVCTSTTCPPPIDSAAGMLDRATADSLFASIA